jgi:hypothetical protein
MLQEIDLKMDGYILVVFNTMVSILQKINIIEILKSLTLRICKPNSLNEKIKISNIVIDIFIIMKWVFLTIIYNYYYYNKIIVIFVLYLLIMNIVTYFYYHVWSEKAITGKARSKEHIRRKFITLMQAIAYNIASFAYLYGVGFSYAFTFDSKYSSWVCAIYHSFSSTFTGGSDFVTPIGNMGLLIQTIQMLTSFMFITLILSKSDEL